MAPFCAHRSIRVILALVLTVLVGATPATAITARDVTGKMTDNQMSAYISGLIDMLAYQTAKAGNNERAICITNTFYRDGRGKGLARLIDVLHNHPDKRPEILVTVLAGQLCKG